MELATKLLAASFFSMLRFQFGRQALPIKSLSTTRPRNDRAMATRPRNDRAMAIAFVFRELRGAPGSSIQHQNRGRRHFFDAPPLFLEPVRGSARYYRRCLTRHPRRASDGRSHASGYRRSIRRCRSLCPIVGVSPKPTIIQDQFECSRALHFPRLLECS